HLGRERGPCRQGVEAEHTAPGGLQELDRKLADQAEADDGDALSQAAPSEPYRMQRNGADRCEGRLLGRHPGWNGRRQVAGDEVVRGVRRMSTPGTGDEGGDGVVPRA